MIVSASRRTDLPAFYTPWLLRRLGEGEVLVPSPRHPHRLSRIPLTPDVVDCLVFWTKNPTPLLPHLRKLEQSGYSFYFQITLTPYGSQWEPGVPPVTERIAVFQLLASVLGPGQVVWRYDPVLLSPQWTVQAHQRAFEGLASALEGCTDQVVFSFLDWYAGMGKRMREVQGRCPSSEEEESLAAAFVRSARAHGMEASVCCERDFSRLGISASSCIDRERIQRITGFPLKVGRDTGQRAACHCVKSVDIGTYGTCPHGCRYCYANPGPEAVRRQWERHDPSSPLLLGHPGPEDEIIPYPAASLRVGQTSLFD